MQTGARYLAKNREILDPFLYKKLAIEVWLKNQAKCMEIISKMEYHERIKLSYLFKLNPNAKISGIVNRETTMQHGVRR